MPAILVSAGLKRKPIYTDIRLLTLSEHSHLFEIGKDMKHVRIAFEEQETGKPLCFDTVIGVDGKIAHRIPFAGWYGKIKSGYLRPVVFMPDGLVKYASDPEDSHEETHNKMNVFDVELKVGARITMVDFEEDEVTTFLIKQVTDLSDLPTG